MFSEEVRRIRTDGSTGRTAADRIEWSIILFTEELEEDGSIRARLLPGDPVLCTSESCNKSSLIFETFVHSIMTISIYKDTDLYCVKILDIKNRN